MKAAPNVHWNADPNEYYTLIMTDPDAPSRESPKFREWHHWLVVNIPGNNIAQGEEKTSYFGAAPPANTGMDFTSLFIINFLALTHLF